MKRVPLPAISLVLLAWPGMVHAQIEYTWANPDGGSYETASNWTPNSGIPDSDNEGAIFALDNQYLVSLTSDISTDYAIVRDGTATLDLGDISTPRTYMLNSLTVAPTAGGENPHLSVANGTLRATRVQVAGGGRLEQVNRAVLDFDNGAATITGSGSTWTSVLDLVVGRSGAGRLLIEDGGKVENSFYGYSFIGSEPGSIGSVIVTGSGSSWTSSHDLRVGFSGVGTLLIEDGGKVENGFGSVGSAFGSIGSVIVTGSGSSWTSSLDLFVGSSGSGMLLIEDGGKVENNMGSIGSELASIGSGSIGSVVVTGTGSTWTSNGQLSVGYSGAGRLLIEDGGYVENAAGAIGANFGSIGSVIVTGSGSTWTSSRNLFVGYSGAGALLIENGGNVENDSGSIGEQPGSTGTVTVTGSGSTWTNVDALWVGAFSGQGTLLIREGGKVENSSTGYIGFYDSTGTVSITGNGSTWNVGNDIWVGSAFSGTATLNIGPGGTVTVAESTLLSPNGLLRLQGGTLATTLINFTAGGEFNWTSGTLHVEQFLGDLENRGGTLAPGQSVGETTVTGDYTHRTGATLEIEIGGPAAGTGHDRVTVDGDILLEGGELRLTLLDDFVPNFDHTFTILEFDGAMSGQFHNVANGERLDTADGLGSFLVHYGPQSPFNPNQIVLSAFEPDPGANNIFGDRFEQ